MVDEKIYHTFEEVVQKFEPQSVLLCTWELKGGVSAQVTAIEIERPDGCTKKMIVRQHGEVDLKRNPRIATDEFVLLRLLHSVGLVVPEPYYLDESGEIFPTPSIVIEYIEGETVFELKNVADTPAMGGACVPTQLPHPARPYATLHTNRQTCADFLDQGDACVPTQLPNSPAPTRRCVQVTDLRWNL